MSEFITIGVGENGNRGSFMPCNSCACVLPHAGVFLHTGVFLDKGVLAWHI